MTSFAYAGALEQTLLLLLLFAAALPQLFLTIEHISRRGYSAFFLNGILLFAELLFYASLLTVHLNGKGAERFPLPTVFLWLAEAALLAYAVVGCLRLRGAEHRTLSRESIKEGIDNMPDGVCFFDEHGAVRLINRKLLSLGMMLFGSEIQTLDELRAGLAHPPSGVERLNEALSLYRFPDGAVCRFTERVITDRDGAMVTEVVAADVTELYGKQEELNRENARLAEANLGMKRLLDNMSEIVREEEILSMKLRVHDDIGYSILSARRALLQQQDIAVIRENAALWEAAVGLLDRANHMSPLPDEWETLCRRADDLGVEIVLDGALPEQDLPRHLLSLALRECMNNCVRHAGGSRLFAALTRGNGEVACVITNDGKAPEGEITEGGGLSGLRRRIEGAGGRMDVQSSPRFALTVTLPMKETSI